MIRYQISTGDLTTDGVVVGKGYSGQPSCKNDPTKCDQHDQGPIPPGRYAIGSYILGKPRSALLLCLGGSDPV